MCAKQHLIQRVFDCAAGTVERCICNVLEYPKKRPSKRQGTNPWCDRLLSQHKSSNPNSCQLIDSVVASVRSQIEAGDQTSYFLCNSNASNSAATISVCLCVSPAKSYPHSSRSLAFLAPDSRSLNLMLTVRLSLCVQRSDGVGVMLPIFLLMPRQIAA